MITVPSPVRWEQMGYCFPPPQLSLCLTLAAEVFAALVVIALNAKYYLMMKGGGGYTKLSERTKALQMMLFRAQLFQLTFFLAFQIMPVVTIIVFQGLWYIGRGEIVPIDNNDYTMIAIGFTCFHSFFDYFSILYFIRPYREFTSGWVRAAVQRLWPQKKCPIYKVEPSRRSNTVVIETKDNQTI